MLPLPNLDPPLATQVREAFTGNPHAYPPYTGGLPTLALSLAEQRGYIAQTLTEAESRYRAWVCDSIPTPEGYRVSVFSPEGIERACWTVYKPIDEMGRYTYQAWWDTPDATDLNRWPITYSDERVVTNDAAPAVDLFELVHGIYWSLAADDALFLTRQRVEDFRSSLTWQDVWTAHTSTRDA